MPIEKILKRNGEILDFDRDRIVSAISRAAQATQSATHGWSAPSAEAISKLADEVVQSLENEFLHSVRLPSVEHIQDTVEHALVQAGQFEVARTYILYRAEHARLRAEKRIDELAKIDKGLLKVQKHGGRPQVFRIDKLKATFARAAEGFESSCRFEELFERFKLTIVENIATAQLMKNLRKVCLDLVSVNNIHWQNVAGRLYVMDLYKQAARNRHIKLEEIYSPEAFREHVDRYIELGRYNDFYAHYSPEDIQEAGKLLDRRRDFSYIYSTVLAFDRRYLLNPNQDIQELPQEMYLCIALFLAIPEPKSRRLQVAQDIYEVISSQKLSLPTPTLLNARTNFHQLSSCFKLNVDDDLRAIYHSLENMAQISKFGGGVGVYLGHIRAKGAAIRGLKGASGGVIPWVRLINNTAAAVNQLGSRLGAISPTLDIWHRDILDYLNLQVEAGDIRAKAFDIFPAVSVPDIFMRRVKANQDWTLFDPHEIFSSKGKRLEDLFGAEFDKMYEECENDPAITVRLSLPAKDLMKRFLKTVVETGMPYVFFRDTVNQLNPNQHAGRIYSTQLCTEICQNTSDSHFQGEVFSKDGKVTLQYVPGDTVVCNLASINVAKVNTDEEITKIISIALRVLDNVITLNYYPIQEAELTAKRYRSVGLGFMGLAEHLACSGLMYGSAEAREHVDRLFEKYAFATLQSSCDLAKERGAYELFPGSEWAKGILFGHDAEWFRENSSQPERWLKLIEQIKRVGVRFAYHLAPAPNTSTAAVVGTTAGLLPVYKKFFVETNVLAPLVTVAPNLSSKNFWYYKEYVHMDLNDVIDTIAVVYKWIDQSVSFEWLINPAKTSPAELYGYYMRAWESRIKTVYYLRSMSGEVKEDCVSCSG